MKGMRHEPFIVYIALLGVGLLCGFLTGQQIGALRSEDRLTSAAGEDCQTPEAPQVRAALVRQNCVASTVHEELLNRGLVAFTGWPVCSGY